MKMRFSSLVVSLLFTLISFASQPLPVTTYSVTLQDERGVETQVLSVATGDGVRQLKMAAGTVEIQAPASDTAPTLLRLYVQKNGSRFLAHTALISEQQPIRVAYSICRDVVTYHSPAPQYLAKCPQN